MQTLLFLSKDWVLDSIDALELILLMERKYQVKITDPKERRVVLRNVRAMAECIQQNKTA